MQIELDRRIEVSGDQTRIELFQSVMVNTGIRVNSKSQSMIFLISNNGKISRNGKMSREQNIVDFFLLDHPNVNST